MLTMPRLPGSAAAFIAALASYRPLPNTPPRDGEGRGDRRAVAARTEAKASARPARRRARRS